MATDVLGPLMTTILSEVVDELSPAPGRAALYPGAEVAYDDCCDGQAWVRMAEMTPAGAVASPSLQTCGVQLWSVTLGVGVLRCAAGLDDQGNAPSVDALNADSAQMTLDQVTILEVLQCTVAGYVDKLVFVRWDPIGPEGGCVGGEWMIQVRTTGCSCP